MLAVQGIGLGAMFVSLVWANGLLGLGLYRQILAISLAGLLLTAVLVAVLVPIDGAQGAAIGASTGEVVLAIAQCVAVVRRRPLLRPSLRVLPGVALAAALGAGAAGAHRRPGHRASGRSPPRCSPAPCCSRAPTLPSCSSCFPGLRARRA